MFKYLDHHQGWSKKMSRPLFSPTKRVLIDNGNLADILYYPAFQWMRINKELLRLMNVPLIRFGGMKLLPVSTISLPVVVGSCCRLFILVQCHYWTTNFEQLEGYNVHLPLICQIPNEVWHRRRRSRISSDSLKKARRFVLGAMKTCLGLTQGWLLIV